MEHATCERGLTNPIYSSCHFPHTFQSLNDPLIYCQIEDSHAHEMVVYVPLIM